MVGGIHDRLQECMIHWPCHHKYILGYNIFYIMRSVASAVPCSHCILAFGTRLRSQPAEPPCHTRSEKLRLQVFVADCLLALMPFQPIHACCQHPCRHYRFQQGWTGSEVHQRPSPTGLRRCLRRSRVASPGQCAVRQERSLPSERLD